MRFAIITIILATGSILAASLATAQRRATPAWVYEAMERMQRRERERPRPPSETPYPSESDTAIEVAFALCIATRAAQGYEPGGIGGAYFDCLGSTVYTSMWRQHTRQVLADHGLASAFATAPRAAWERCIDAMLRGRPAVLRAGQGFERYCIPSVRRAGRAARN